MIFDPSKSGWPCNTTEEFPGKAGLGAMEALEKRQDDASNGIGNESRPPCEHACFTAPNIDDLYDHLKEVYHRKNHDYGNSFEDGLNEDGIIFAKMHLMEKYNRFKKLITEQNQVNGEGIRDSLLDMANYAIMTVHWLDKRAKLGQTD